MVQRSKHPLTYEEAVGRLNSLQSNAAVIQKLRKQREKMQEKNLAETLNFLSQLNIKLDEIDMLNPIHVSGTKGKGSTCAFVESILRQLGFRTGFYSSPHLVHVRERIKINGVSLSEELFTKYFSIVYDQLQENCKNGGVLPAYFKFLTLMAFYVFVKERVDVAVIEVGIGGEHDCTNIIKNPVVCGITTLDFDHTNLLGSTLKEIAWQKAGIFKPGSVAVVADQTEETMDVFTLRSIEKQCALYIAPPLDLYIWPSNSIKVGIPGEHQRWNISLALQLARIWLERTGNNGTLFPNETITNNRPLSTLDGYRIPETFLKGLSRCVWPGRSQVLKRGPVTYYIDGAHTPKSLQCCVEWYLSERKQPPEGNKTCRVLLFHCTADRTPECLLPYLKECGFDMAFFTPPRIHFSVDGCSDQANFNASAEHELLKVKHNAEVWKSLTEETCTVEEFNCITAVMERIEALKKQNDSIEVLITGSLHLVGGLLSVIG